jgi:hypothetical protein
MDRDELAEAAVSGCPRRSESRFPCTKKLHGVVSKSKSNSATLNERLLTVNSIWLDRGQMGFLSGYAGLAVSH